MAHADFPPEHGQCRQCRAWTRRDARHCPVCGVVAPLSWLRRGAEALGSWRGIGGGAGMVAGIAAGMALGVWVHTLSAALLAMVGAALSVAGGFALGQQLGVRWGQQVVNRRRPNNLLGARDAAVQAQGELEQDLRKIDALRQRLRRDLPPAPAEPLLHALDAAYDAAEGQLQRHRVQAWQLTLGIWQNRLAPALAVWRKADEALAAAELQRVDQARGELQQLISAWRAHPSADGDEGQRVLGHAERLAEAAAQLRQALLVRQALSLTSRSPGARQAFDAAALPAVEPLEERALDVLRVRLAVQQEHSNALAQQEALRLRSEQQAIAEVEALLAAGPGGRPEPRR